MQQPGWWFAFRGSELLVHQDENGTRIPSGTAVSVPGLTLPDWHNVGHVGGQPCLAGEVPAAFVPPTGMTFVGLRDVYGKVEPALFRMAGRAVQIVDWDRTHRFCGRCGGATGHGEHEGARKCTVCGALHFPRLAPAVIVLVRDGERTLLARAHYFKPGLYSTIAGFVEPGETLEEAVEREVAEEVGVRLTNIRYFGSQPWPFPHSLMIGFTADYAGGEIRRQEEEIADACWFHVDSLPEVPSTISIARALIDWFVADCQARRGARD